MEVEAEATGTLLKILAQAGDVVPEYKQSHGLVNLVKKFQEQANQEK